MIYLIIGIVLVALAAADIIYTVLSSNGAGYLSKHSMNYTAAFFQYWARRTNSRKILKFTGVSLLSSIIVIWVSLLWFGVFLIFSSDRRAVLDSAALTPAGAIDRFYFSGYILSTLGNGDFKPQAGVWQIVTTLFTFSGFIFLTTGITYFVSIISAITQKRLLALSIFNLGATSEKMRDSILKLHRGNQLMSEITSLKNLLNSHALNHRAYPISHYFFTTEKKISISVAVAELNQALEKLREDEENDRNLAVQLELLRGAFYNYLQVLSQRFLKPLLKPNLTINEKEIEEAKTRELIIKAFLYNDVWIDELTGKGGQNSLR